MLALCSVSVKLRFSIFAERIRLLVNRLTLWDRIVTMLKASLTAEVWRIAYRIITEKCATAPWLCGDCRPGCPNQAISTAHVIDPDRCTECVGAYESPHCADVCPVGACVPDPERRETKEQLLERWRSLHPEAERASET